MVSRDAWDRAEVVLGERIAGLADAGIAAPRTFQDELFD